MSRHSERLTTAFPFSGQLIDGKAAASWLLSKVDEAPPGVSLCSAFLRTDALRVLYTTESDAPRGRILSRWRLSDILSGASDLDAFPVAKRLGFKFFIRQDFHGKVFSIPGSGIIVGSANATLSGFGLKASSNSEVCTLVPHFDSNQTLLDEIFDGAIELTDSLFQAISKVVEGVVVSKIEEQEWPSDLMDKLEIPEFSGRLLFSECFVSVPSVDQNGFFAGLDERDLHLLGLRAANLELVLLKQAFKATRIFRWLVHALKSSNGEMYFGSLSESLHNTLLDNPVVYRRDVKIVLQTLLQWCQLLEGVGVVVDRPNHSQRVRLA